jgi:transcriptional regulator with XRE-family HTH domain
MSIDEGSPKRANLEDVARRAGVSRQTASRVINNTPKVSVSARMRVLEAIAELHYRPDPHAQALARRRRAEPHGEQGPRSRVLLDGDGND